MPYFLILFRLLYENLNLLKKTLHGKNRSIYPIKMPTPEEFLFVVYTVELAGNGT
jgi:hypothetical protein